MTDAPAAKRRVRGAPYDRDVYAWSQEQARLLRAGRFEEIDAVNIAEEILDVGRSEYDKLESALAVLLMHMLKWDHQPELRSRSWEATILEQRKRVERQLRDNPSLKSRRDEAVSASYELGLLRASGETDKDPAEFPEFCPYEWDEIMHREFRRAPGRHK